MHPEAPSQQGDRLTTSTGVPVRDTDHSLKATPRGPTLLQDHHLREKITHFDHERIPERVVHARGAGAHGTFEAYGTASSVCRAAFLAAGVETPVFVRFSTVLGSRGSADTVRDTRGFATKFYTEEGTFDLVGNNIPVFFIQDGIKFPDVIHAGKPHPDREIPQAQSAHDTFWDFVSLHTEAQHHTIWNMSDRGIPRSYRTMEGFGVHTFRVVAEDGTTSLVKFHWKPDLGVHSLTWEEAQLLGGIDPDFHRRDLYDALAAGALPSWELGMQVMPDAEDQLFEGIDLLDPTKLVPEEWAPVQPVGRLTLERGPRNFFAEVEQVAFHVGHLVPGIDVTDDPLLQTRLFSYVDTQLTRLGGPNFNQLPINRPHAPVNDMLRDGFHQQDVHTGVAPYRPNSLDGGCPMHVGADGPALEDLATAIPAGHRVRANPISFEDHLTQPRMFWASLDPVEQDHVVEAYCFELGKCLDQTIVARQAALLAVIDTELGARVAAGLGLPAPEPTEGDAAPDVVLSPALSQLGRRWPVAGRRVGVVLDPTRRGADAEWDAVRAALEADGVTALLVVPDGALPPQGTEPVADHTLHTARSVEFDALVVADPPAVAGDARYARLLGEAHRHLKALGAWGAGAEELLTLVGDDVGVVTAADPAEAAAAVLDLLAEHRVWARGTVA